LLRRTPKTTLLAGYLVTSQNPYRRTVPELRVVGVDDGAFAPHIRSGQHTILVAILFRDLSIHTIRVGRIEVDGTDARSVLTSMLKNLRFDVVMLSGISFGGFNLINLSKLARALGKPVIAVTGKKPENVTVEKALRSHFNDWKDRMKVVRAAGRIHSIKPLAAEPALYFEVKGGSPDFAKGVIRSYAIISRLPEPIRVAGILARGLSRLPFARTKLP
jgi:uncharacterized protein